MGTQANDWLGRLRRGGEKLLPRYVLDRLDPIAKALFSHTQEFSAILPPRSWVLDAGAGEAQFRSLFSHHRYVAVDSGEGDPSWDYSRLDVIADVMALPFSENRFNAALSLVVLEHLQEPSQALSEMFRVLRPGGKLLLVAPLIWEIHQAPHDYYRFTRYGLMHLLSVAGFTQVEIEPLGGFFQLVGRYSFYFLKFWNTGLRVVLLPLLAPLFGLVIPLLCYYLDPLDRTGQYTLAYVCKAQKP